MTRKNKRIILIICIVVVVFSVCGVLSYLSTYVKPVPDGTVGNTAGNLNNKGLFCEYDRKVYFSNAYDNGALYCMNPDETEIKKLNNSKAEYINAGGDYLVYYQAGSSASGTGSLEFVGAMDGIYRTNLKGRDTVCLDDDAAGGLLLVDNYVYYSHYDTDSALTLRKIRLNKKDAQTLTDYWIQPACCVNGRIYYNGTTDDRNLYAWNTATDTKTTIWEGNIWNPIVSGDYVYYLDVADNYKLCRCCLTDGSVITLTDERVDSFNVSENIIYYQTLSSTEPALKRMHVDGSVQELVRTGVHTNINVTSEYVYFNAYDSEVPVYKTSTYGPINVVTFDAALNAAMENME